MFRQPRRVVPTPPSRPAPSEVAKPRVAGPQAGDAGYHAGVRQVLNENRGFAAIAGAIMIAVGGSIIASQAYDEHAARRPHSWRCTPAVDGYDGDGCSAGKADVLRCGGGEVVESPSCADLTACDAEPGSDATTAYGCEEESSVW